MTSTPTVDSSTRVSRRAIRVGGGGRRTDLDGLRAFAILLVVVYHVWLGRVSGGVDVFLLLSAYFLTTSFLRRSEAVGPPHLLVFWRRRFARLVPAAAIVIVAVLGFTALALPPSQWRGQWTQAWASLLYVQNWQLTAESVDYYARTTVFPSALQHFWSLSVQGQVFVIWPVVLWLSLAAARRWCRSPRIVLTIVFSALFLVSMAYSIHLTAVDQQAAYFSTWARLWEFALGSLAAVVLPSLRIPSVAARVLGWGGILALVSCGVVLDVEAGFPGVAALWPTLAAVAVIAAGQSAVRPRASRLLESPLLQWVARIGYPLYLVHWPILVGVMVIANTPRLGVVAGTAVIAVSIAAGWALQRALERSVLRALGDPRRAVVAIVAPMLVVIVPLGAWQASSAARTALTGPETYPGAAVLMPWVGVTAEERSDFAPRGTQLSEEWIHLDDSCSGRNAPSSYLLASTCSEKILDPDGPTILLVGNSHAQQWMGSLLPVLEADGWNTVALLKGGCQLAPGEDADDECDEWRQQAVRYAVDSSAEVVAMMGTRALAGSAEERVPHGLDGVVTDVVDSGSQVLLIRDNPRFLFDMFVCAEGVRDPAACALPRAQLLAERNPALEISGDERVHAIDLTDYLCPDSMCGPVIGNVAVYMDDNHPTATYMTSLAPAARAAFAEIPGIPIG